MTPAERLIWDDYLKSYPKDRGTNPPTEIPRTPAEWEEMQGVVITWEDDYSGNYLPNLREIVRYAKDYVKVYIVCSSPSNVLSYLSQGGVDSENVECV